MSGRRRRKGPIYVCRSFGWGKHLSFFDLDDEMSSNARVCVPSKIKHDPLFIFSLLLFSPFFLGENN